jgi:hypothetical protein
MDNPKCRGDRGKDTRQRKRRTNVEIHRDNARNRESTVRALNNNANAFAQSGFIFSSRLQDQGQNNASAEPPDDPTVVVPAPTRKDYDEIEINDDFDGDDDNDDDTGDVCDDGTESASNSTLGRFQMSIFIE